MYFSLKHNKYLRDLKKESLKEEINVWATKKEKKASVALICSPVVANHYLIWGR